MSKTRTGFRRAHCLAPVGGGGGYLLSRLGGVNRPFRALRHFREASDLTAKITAGCRGEALKVRDDSIEAREHTHFSPKIKRQVRRRAVVPI